MTALALPAPPSVIEDIDWARPRPNTRGYRLDALLAAVLFVGTIVAVLLYRAAGTFSDAPLWASLLWAVGMTAPLAARRRFPATVAAVVSALYAVGVIAQVAELLFSQIAVFIALYSVGAWSRSRLLAGVARGLIVLGMFAWLFWSLIYFSAVSDYLPEVRRTGGGPISPYVAFSAIQIITNLLYFGGAWYFGDAAYRAARGRAALEQRTAELAAERERTRAQAVALERVRIARELHDVVAHHVSVMGVQAGAARMTLATDPEAAARSLSAIEASAREAVDELHRLLGTLREDGQDAADPSTHGLDQLPALAREASEAGLPTAFNVVGDARPVPATVGFAAYRITQEALTNVRKHAGRGATADVRVRYLPASLELEIANTGAARTTAVGTGGLGLIGMRERADAVGAVLEAGPRSRGGWLVRVAFPMGAGFPAADVPTGANFPIDTDTPRVTGARMSPNFPMDAGAPMDPNTPMDTDAPTDPNTPMDADAPTDPNSPMDADAPMGTDA